MAEKNKVVLTFLGNTDQLEGKISKLKQSFAGIGRISLIAFGAVSAGIGLATKTFATFESKMSTVKALTGATGDDFDSLTNTAKELGAETVFSASKAAEGMKFLGLAGFQTNQIIEAMPGLLNLAAAGQLELGKASDLVTDILALFNLEAKEANRLADLMAKTSSTANTDVGQLGEAMLEAGGTAKVFNMTLEETSAALGQIANLGLKGTKAGTSLNRMLIDLGQNSKKLEKLGINVFDTNGQFRKLADIIQDVEKATAGLNDKEKAQLINQASGIFGRQSLLRLLTAGSKKLREYTKELENSNGFAKQMAKIMIDNLGGAFTLLKSAIEGALIDLGSKFAPIIKLVVEALTKLFTIFNKLPSIFKTFIATIILLTAGLTGLVTVLAFTAVAFLALSGGVVSGMNALKAFNFSALATKFSIMKLNPHLLFTNLLFKRFTITALIASFFRLSKSIAASIFSLKGLKIALASTGIGVLIVAIGTLFIAWQKNFKGIRDITETTVEFLKIVFEDTIKFWFEMFSGFFKWIGESFMSFAEDTLLVLEFLLNKIRALFGKSNISISGDLKTVLGIWTNDWKKAVAIVAKNRREKNKEEKENEEKNNKGLVNSLANASKNKVAISKEESNQILAIKNATTLSELDLLQFAIDTEKEQRILALEQKIIDWTNEGIAKNEIERMFKEEAQLINNEFALREQLLESKRTRFKQAEENKKKSINAQATKDFGDTITLIGQMSKEGAIVQRGISIGKATVSTFTGAAKALELPFPANLAAMAKVLVSGFAQVSGIRAVGFKVGTDEIKSDKLAFLHSGEIVVPSEEAKFLKSGKLALTASPTNTQNKTENNSGGNTIIFEGGLFFGNKEEFIDSVHEMLSEKISGNFLTPLPVKSGG